MSTSRTVRRRHPPRIMRTAMTEQTIALNRRARHEYAVEETLEAGIVLTGTEIKSIRAGRVNLAEAYARIEHGEAWLIGAHIAPYEQGNRYNHEPRRTRKLLLHRDQIAELVGLHPGQGPDPGPAAPLHPKRASQAGAGYCTRQEDARQAPHHR